MFCYYLKAAITHLTLTGARYLEYLNVYQFVKLQINCYVIGLFHGLAILTLKRG